MYECGFAQEIITPPVGVGLAGYFEKRPNQGMHDDLYVKVLMFRAGGKTFGFMVFDLCNLKDIAFKELDRRISAAFGQNIRDGLIISTTHTHTGPLFPNDLLKKGDKLTRFAFQETMDAAIRALRRALMNILPVDLEVGSVYNNPYAFVRRFWMKNGEVLTNPGRNNPDIDKPEGNFDRTITILAVKQKGRLAALLCNIANHGDTTGGNLVSADWYGRFEQAIQFHYRTSVPVIVVDDASGNLNHFDLNQRFPQSSFKEAARIGRGYAAIVLDAMDSLVPVPEGEVRIANATVDLPHRKVTAQELERARCILSGNIPPELQKELNCQALSQNSPHLMKYFAQMAVDCHELSDPSHPGRFTVIQLGKTLAFASVPGEAFNGIAQAIRQNSPCAYTMVIELAQSECGYVPMAECFEHGGYEVQPNRNSAAPETAQIYVDTVSALF